MENKELPTSDKYLEIYSIREGFKDASDMVRFCNEWSNNHIVEYANEYAQIVAEYRSEQSLIEANNRMIDQAFKLGIHKQLIESLEMAIMNAYKV